MSLDCGYEQYVYFEDDCSNVENIKTKQKEYIIDIDSEEYGYLNEESFDSLDCINDLKNDTSLSCMKILWNLTLIGCQMYISTRLLYHYVLKK